MDKKKILIIDDDPYVAKAFNEALSVNGFKGDVYTDSLSALSNLKNNINGYDRVVCDIRMPGKSGIEVAKEVKKSIPGLRIILMSSNENDYYENNEAKDISDDFVLKPKDFDGFLKLLSNS